MADRDKCGRDECARCNAGNCDALACSSRTSPKPVPPKEMPKITSGVLCGDVTCGHNVGGCCRNLTIRMKGVRACSAWSHPMPPAPAPEFPGLAEYFNEVEKQLRKGKKKYGGSSFERPLLELLGEIEQEAAGICGWGYPIMVRLWELRVKIEAFERRMKQTEPIVGSGKELFDDVTDEEFDAAMREGDCSPLAREVAAEVIKGLAKLEQDEGAKRAKAIEDKLLKEGRRAGNPPVPYAPEPQASPLAYSAVAATAAKAGKPRP